MAPGRTRGSPGLSLLRCLVLVALLPGCAELGGHGLDQDVAALRRDLGTLVTTTQRARTETEAQIAQLDRRSRDQAAEASRQVNALAGRLDALTADLGRQAGRLDDMSRRIEALRSQLAARPTSPSRPEPGPAPAQPPAPPASGSAATQPAPIARPSTPATTTAEEVYQAAALDLSRGRYQLAVSSFQEFLRRFPDSRLADSAQYGIGEAYYSMGRASAAQKQPDRAGREWEQAVREFRKVSLYYPRGSKVPTALYKEALALTELKQTALAQSRLQYLVDTFPQSEEAPLAREKLAALKP